MLNMYANKTRIDAPSFLTKMPARQATSSGCKTHRRVRLRQIAFTQNHTKQQPHTTMTNPTELCDALSARLMLATVYLQYCATTNADHIHA